MLEEIEKQTTNASVLEDFSFSQLFDSNNLESKSFEFLKEFIRAKLKINEIARAKGLLDSEKFFQNDELEYHTDNINILYKKIEKADESGLNYLVLPNTQENTDGKMFTFVCSKDDAKLL